MTPRGWYWPLSGELHSVREDEATKSVLSTCFLTFEGIEKQLPLAADIIRLMAFLDCRGITEELLVDSGLEGVKNEILFRKAITTLLDFSLISMAKDKKTYEIHRIVELSIEASLSQHDFTIWKAKALEVVWCLFSRDRRIGIPVKLTFHTRWLLPPILMAPKRHPFSAVWHGFLCYMVIMTMRKYISDAVFAFEKNMTKVISISWLCWLWYCGIEENTTKPRR